MIDFDILSEVARKVYTSETGELLTFNPEEKMLESVPTKALYNVLDMMVREGYMASYRVINFQPSDLPNDQGELDELRPLTEEILDLMIKAASLAWINKGATVVEAFDEDGNTIPFTEGKFGPFEFESGEKLMKRLTFPTWDADLELFGQTIRWVGEGYKVRRLATEVDHYDNEVAIHRHNDEVVIREIVREDMLLDGQFFVSESFFIRMMRASKHTMSAEKYEEMKSVKTFNARFITGKGQIKGNFVVVPDSRMGGADIEVETSDNLKHEVWSSDGLFYGVAMIEHTKWFGAVKMDRQSRQHMMGLLFDIPTLRSWTEEWVDNLLYEVDEGRFPTAVLETMTSLKGDNEAIFNNRARVFYDKNLRVDASVGMLASTRMALETMISPVNTRWDSFTERYGKRADNQKVPFKFASYLLMKSETTARKAGLIRHSMKPGSVRIIKSYGWIVIPDEDYDRVFGLLGGADQDDHCKVFLYIDANTNKTMVALLRNPQGNRHGVDEDGNKAIATEYWLAELLGAKRILRQTNYHVEDLPVLDMTNRPYYIDELEYPNVEPFNDARTPCEVYNLQWVSDFAIATAKAMMAYGSHSNLLSIAWANGVHLSDHGEESTFVDAAQQYPSAQSVEALDEINFNHLCQILDQVDEMDKIDYDCKIRNLVKRYQLKANVTLIDGDSSALYDIINDAVGEIRTGFMPIFERSKQRIISSFDYNRGSRHIYEQFKFLTERARSIKEEMSDKDGKVKLSSAEFDIIANLISSQYDNEKDFCNDLRDSLAYMANVRISLQELGAGKDMKIGNRTDQFWLAGKFLVRYADMLSMYPQFNLDSDVYISKKK